MSMICKNFLKPKGTITPLTNHLRTPPTNKRAVLGVEVGCVRSGAQYGRGGGHERPVAAHSVCHLHDGTRHRPPQLTPTIPAHLVDGQTWVELVCDMTNIYLGGQTNMVGVRKKLFMLHAIL